MLSNLSKQRLIDLLLVHVRNTFRVDGLYFLGIEGKFGIDAATQIDKDCWNTMGSIEAHELKKLISKPHYVVPDVMHLLQYTSWSLNNRDKEIEISEQKGVFRVTRCRTQLTRMQKGLPEFSCKDVRFEYLKAFVAVLNPQINIECRMCPPDRHSKDSWCEWEFTMQRSLEQGQTASCSRRS